MVNAVIEDRKPTMNTKITIVTASTDVQSGTTTTFATTLPSGIMDLPSDKRDFTASRAMVETNQPLKNVEAQLPNAVGPLLDGKNEASFIREGPVVNVFNISGPNARVYIKSQDRSTNIANITPEQVFAELREIISTSIQGTAKRSALLSKVEELEETRGTSGFARKYSEFIALTANHIALFSPLLPALTQWLL